MAAFNNLKDNLGIDDVRSKPKKKEEELPPLRFQLVGEGELDYMASYGNMRVRDTYKGPDGA